jgi:hypothetical protein
MNRPFVNLSKNALEWFFGKIVKKHLLKIDSLKARGKGNKPILTVKCIHRHL